MERDSEMYGRDMLSRMPARLFRLTGSSFLREASKRIETKGFKLDRVQGTRRIKVAKVLTMLENAKDEKDYDKAYKEVNAWNKSFPDFPILMSDINMKKIMKRKMQRHKKKVLG